MWFAFLAVLVLWAQTSWLGVSNGYTRSYDPVVGRTTESLTFPLDPHEVNLQVAIVYAGDRRKAVPERIELLISPNGHPIGDARTVESSVKLLADGHVFSCSTRNARDAASTNAVALLCTFDQFRVLADARTVAGQAFGIAFSINPERLLAVHELADAWAIPE